MKDMMEKMMARMAKPEDMLGMMNAMMDRMFSGMTTDDRIRFMTTMMTQCLAVVMAQMTPEERQKLAREMVDRLVALFQAETGKQSP
jgi:hypothetical protein